MAYNESFTTLAEKRKVISERKFKVKSKQYDTKPVYNSSFVPDELETLQRIKEASVNEYKVKRTASAITSVPYITNEVEGVNIFKEVRDSNDNRKNIKLNEIIISIMSGMAKVQPVEFCKENRPSNILLIVHHPINSFTQPERNEIVWSSHIVNKCNYFEYHITDICLYTLVKRYSKYAWTLTGSNTLYLPGMDIRDDDELVSMAVLEDMFVSLSKIIFVTSTLGRNLNMLDMLDYPGYNFSLGTYKLGGVILDKLERIMQSETLLYVVPYWQNVISWSFTIEIPTNKLNFLYNPMTPFEDFCELKVTYVPSVTPRSKQISNIARNVTLRVKENTTTRSDVYDANIKIRNRLASSLDRVKSYNKIKDKLYPKSSNGARTKLESILNNYDLKEVKSALDLGCAPGTWTRSLIENYKIQSVHSVTRTIKGDLQMYDDVVDLVSKTPNCYIHFQSVETFINDHTLMFDMIVSDVATNFRYYVTQAAEHDLLFLSILKYIQCLNDGGIFVMKLYDLTPTIRLAISKFASHFRNMEFVKPYGSCQTNSEMYLVCSGYKLGCADFSVCEVQVQNILYNQIIHLENLIKNGFNKSCSYKLIYHQTQLDLEDISQFPINVQLFLSNLKFSEYLFPELTTGVMYHDVSQLNDKFIRFKWNTPIHPYHNTRYITETAIGYESRDLSLATLCIFHHGFIIQNGKRIDFIYVEKELSPLFSDNYLPTYVSTVTINGLIDQQYTFSSLHSTLRFRKLFPSLDDFYTFQSAFKYISLYDVQTYTNLVCPSGVNSALKQFFREAETMRLFYKNSDHGSYISRYATNCENKIINLTTCAGRTAFWQEYQRARGIHRQLRQVFSTLLNKYTIKVTDNELLHTSTCCVTKSYQEYTTGQMCLSQPACFQYRRQHRLF